MKFEDLCELVFNISIDFSVIEGSDYDFNWKEAGTIDRRIVRTIVKAIIDNNWSTTLG